ncbi:hypothetical protein MUK42_08938 [Musa troglodytarum]|uniref:Uncharacterized protein n=1 Tax=Musa troglodytarum TaxID=320322 RepID=A0A9E7JIX5_9LILI|nr:hypothetical protein MUK42_08938 [Musa troglodytarum]
MLQNPWPCVAVLPSYLICAYQTNCVSRMLLYFKSSLSAGFFFLGFKKYSEREILIC